MQSNQPEVTGPAMDIIRELDPGEWHAMTSDRRLWQVFALEGDDDIPASQVRYDLPISHLRDVFNNSLAITFYDGTWTDLNMPAIRDAAAEFGLTVFQMVASNLVHEYDHIKGGDEESAFNRELEFARLLGIPEWIANREETARDAGFIQFINSLGLGL